MVILFFGHQSKISGFADPKKERLSIILDVFFVFAANVLDVDSLRNATQRKLIHYLKGL